MPTSLVRCTYVSCSLVANTDLQDLLEGSKQRNATWGITSGLMCTDQYFCQVVEGPNAVVDELMGRIRNDPRHHSVRVVLQETIATRQFDAWPMGMAVLPHMDQILMPLFTSKDAERAKILGGMLLQALRRQAVEH